jgi:mRNA interferase HigB
MLDLTPSVKAPACVWLVTKSVTPYIPCMRVISRRALREFWQAHRDAEQPLRAWYEEARTAAWKTPADIRAHYRTASFVGSNRVIFNIAGNKYRLVVVVRYRIQRVYVRFVGTHRQYDRVDVSEV